MKSAATVFLIISFIAVAVFGILVMNHGAAGHGGCIGATVGGAACPKSDPISFISFHLNAFRSFSTALPVAGILTEVLLLVLGAIFAATFLAATPFLGNEVAMVPTGALRSVELAPLPFAIKINRWFSLHERRSIVRS